VAFWKRSRDESRSLPRPDNEIPLMAAWTPSTITPLQALQIGDVWSAVRVLSDAASSLPIHVFKRAGDGRQRVTTGKLVDLLERPGPATSQADLTSSLMAHLAVYGNSYLAKYRDAGAIVGLGLLHPDCVRPELDNGQLRFRYSYGGQTQLLSASDVVHIKGLSVDGIIGLSAVQQCARVLGLSDQLVRHALSFFDTGTPTPAGVLQLGEGASFPEQDRTKEKLKAEARHGGVLVIEGDAKYTEITAKLDDSQFATQREISAREVARVFRIPSHMIGASTGDSLTYATVEQEAIDFARYSLQPWLRRIELAVSNDSDLAFQQQFIRFELDGLLRADANTRSEIYARALDPVTGWLDVDEVRALEDLPPRAAAAATNGNNPTTNVEAMIANASN
jgi:HK97 family phage portal protein